MSKRRPGAQLTQDNWDEDEEPQEAGTFSVASAEALKGRQIKKAKRRGATSNSEQGGSAFKAFTGFGGFGAATGGEPPKFAFNVNTTKDSGAAQTNGAKQETNGTVKTESSTLSSAEPSKDRTQYLSQLKCLNESVSKWIQTHVEKNPYCILTPIFKDYETHLSKLEKLDPERGGESQSDSKHQSKQQEDKKVADTKESNKEAEKPADKSAEKPAEKPTFSFGSAANSSDKPNMGFKFGTATNTSTGSGIFGSKPLGGASSAATSGFTFAVSKPATDSAQSAGNKEDDEEYVPPKEEVKTVVEEDAFYTKRCKLFFKKGEAWQDKGVGNLHLKPCDGKTQLLIRADTNLGNILLNILVSNSIPASRQGKNNVMIVCVPNPPLDEKSPDDKTAVSMLIRVKTSADADELFDKIKEATNTSTGSGIFGSKPLGGASSAATSGFTFAVSKPATDSAQSAANKDDDEEYVPPKEEVKTVVEEDAFYTKRCKLFFKKGESWQDKGVGNLHLKPCDGKTQLLIRADTNLGNILLNILVSNNIPASRQGKNNVMIVCVPNPPLDEKSPDDKTAVSMLIRVKTSADADELFDKIKEGKQGK